MEESFFKFYTKWKTNYSGFVMDSVFFIDSEGKEHKLAYIYPISSGIKLTEITDINESKIVSFKRKEISLNTVEKLVRNLNDYVECKEITLPGGAVYEFGTKVFNIEESSLIEGLYGNLGVVSPNYRLVVKSNSGSLFNEHPFTLMSEIKYTDLSTAIKDIFGHPSKIFSKEDYLNHIDCALVIDISHLEWKIHDIDFGRDKVTVEIEPMRHKPLNKPKGLLWLEYSNGVKERIELSFSDENKAECELDKIVFNYEFFLMAESDIGFAGEKYKANQRGKVLDYRAFRQFSSFKTHENFIDLDKLTDKEILKLINQDESEKVEFKGSLTATKGEYTKLGKQLIGMANASLGGIAILGVDKEGNIEGILEPELSDVNDYLQDCLDARCKPWISFDSKKFEIKTEKENKIVYAISILVNEDDLPYSYLSDKKIREFPIRRKGKTKWMSPQEVKDYLKKIYETSRKSSY